MKQRDVSTYCIGQFVQQSMPSAGLGKKFDNMYHEL